MAILIITTNRMRRFIVTNYQQFSSKGSSEAAGLLAALSSCADAQVTRGGRPRFVHERSDHHFFGKRPPQNPAAARTRRRGGKKRFHLAINAYKTNALHNAAKYAALSGTRIVAEEVMRTFPLISGETN